MITPGAVVGDVDVFFALGAGTDEGAIDVTEGGTAIPYWLEDPFLRKEYEETLAKDGVKSRLEDWLYREPANEEERERAKVAGGIG